MSFVKQGIRAGLVVSSLVLCILLLYSYHNYLTPPVRFKLHITGSSTSDKQNSKLQERWHDMAEVKLKHPDSKNQSISSLSLDESQETVEENHCTPRSNIVFFKMHKCSSSTVQNILFRYGEEHKLDFVLPKKGNYLGDMYGVFNKKVMMKFPVKKYNILCHHTRFSYRGMAEVMKSDAVYTTIIRNPVTMYESLFTYSNFDSLYNLPRNRALELFLEQPEHYYSLAHGGKCKARNPMLFDLGLEEALLSDRLKIKKKIQLLVRQFDLVMLTEYFDESLILFRDLMCWEMDDIIYFVLNARNKSSVKAVSPQMADKIRQWNFGDVQLYNTFNRTFWKKVEAFGHERMRQEVAQLRQRREFFEKLCIAEVVSEDYEVWRPPGIDIDSFKLKPEAMENRTCLRMAQTELPYSDRIREIQVQRYQREKG